MEGEDNLADSRGTNSERKIFLLEAEEWVEDKFSINKLDIFRGFNFDATGAELCEILGFAYRLF